MGVTAGIWAANWLISWLARFAVRGLFDLILLRVALPLYKFTGKYMYHLPKSRVLKPKFWFALSQFYERRFWKQIFNLKSSPRSINNISFQKISRTFQLQQIRLFNWQTFGNIFGILIESLKLILWQTRIFSFKQSTLCWKLVCGFLHRMSKSLYPQVLFLVFEYLTGWTNRVEILPDCAL